MSKKPPVPMPADILVGESMAQYSARKAAAPMKKFAGIKTLKVIKAQCKAARITFDDYLYRKKGNDHVRVIGGGATVLFNSFNGRFFGTTDKGVTFNSDSTEHESEPWFQALLAFFYIETINTAAA